MGKKLFVGNLPFAATKEILNKIFSTVGTVESANLVTVKGTRRSKGYGFVEMADDESAQKAIAKFNGADFEGRPMVVSEANPPKPKATSPTTETESKAKAESETVAVTETETETATATTQVATS